MACATTVKHTQRHTNNSNHSYPKVANLMKWLFIKMHKCMLMQLCTVKANLFSHAVFS